jgi:hypothetical protein
MKKNTAGGIGFDELVFQSRKAIAHLGRVLVASLVRRVSLALPHCEKKVY